MAVTGREYASLGKTDMATAVGMRIAMVDALNAFSRLPPPEQTVEAAKQALLDAATANQYLKAAGTSETVSRYYDDLFDRQQNDAQVLAFIKDASQIAVDFDPQNPPSKNQLIMQAISGTGLPAAGDAFNRAAHKHLGIKTLTRDFIETLKAKPELAADLAPAGSLAPRQAQFLSDTHDLMQLADMRETDPAMKVADLLIISSPEREARLRPVVEAACELKQGKNSEANRGILIQAGVLNGEAEHEARKVSDKELGDSVLEAVQRTRLGESGTPAQVGDDLSLINLLVMAIASLASPKVEAQGRDLGLGALLPSPTFPSVRSSKAEVQLS